MAIAIVDGEVATMKNHNFKQFPIIPMQQGMFLKSWLLYLGLLGLWFSSPSSLLAQTRNRSLVAWGESLMGMNRVPDLPPGVSVSDVEEVTAGELVSAVTLRSGIEGYTGSRLILRGPTLLTGTSDGTISYGNGVLDYTDKTTWNTALQGASGVMGLDRVGFGHLFGALIRKPSGSPVPVASGRFKDQFSGDLAFFGDRASAGLPATDLDPAGKFVSVVSSSTHVVALRADGSVKAFGGDNLFGERLIPSGVVGAIEVAAGEFFSAALLSNGQVIVWGSDAYGVVSVPTTVTNVISLRAGASHLIALRGDGTVVAWGNPGDGRTSVPVGLNRVTKISAGRAHSLALRDDGTVVAWGYNGAGQTSVPAGLANVIDIAAGGQHNLVLVSREKPVLDLLSVTESSAQGARDFNPAVDYTDRGRTVTVRATVVNGAPPIQFRWRRNGSLISGATNAQLSLFIAPSDTGAMRIDAEAINLFGSDMESVAIKLAENPSEVSVDVFSWVTTPAPVTAALGRSSSGVFLGVDNATKQLAFNVSAKGDPIPRVNVYDAKTGEAVATETLIWTATASVSGSALVPSTRFLTASSSGSYCVVVGNSLGKTVTNVVTLGVYQDLAANPPNVSPSYSPNATVSSVLGPIPPGTTNLTLSVVSNYGPGVAYQWLKDGVEILRATNSVLSFTNFSFPQIGAYKVRLTNPLTGSSITSDKLKGTVDSGVFNPVLPIAVNLSRTNILGLSGTAGSLEVQLTGALIGRVQLQKFDDALGVWADASSTFPVLVPGLPAAWSGGTYDLGVTAGGGVASFTVGTSNLLPSMSGYYRIRVVQLAASGGTELAGSAVTSLFQVVVLTPAALSLPVGAPSSLEGGGTWISGASSGVDMTVSAAAFSMVDLSTYLSVSGFPGPVFRWERQTDAASGSSPAKFQVVSVNTNSPSLWLAAVPTNAGIYRITATNSVGGVTGVFKTIALRVDRVLRIPEETLVVPGGIVSEAKPVGTNSPDGIPISLVGFGDESALSFTIQARTPYLLESNFGLSIDLDPSIANVCTITSRKTGSVVAAPANGGLGGNLIKFQVLINRGLGGFPRGTNTIARLYLRAQSPSAIETIRTLGSSGVAEAPSLRVPIQILKDSELVTADRDLSFRVAFTNATIAPSTFEGGDVVVLADSVEGDVNNSGSTDVVDITAIASALAASTFPDTNSVTKRRMDCAPRESYGDWAVNLADLVQVARYAAKLDSTQAAQDPLVGGPGYTLNRSQRPAATKSLPRNGATEPVRSIHFGWSDLVTGQEAWVPVVLNGVGNENAFAFNVEFDPKALEFTGLRAPNGTSSMENRTAAAAGRIGAVLWKQAGQSAPAGSSVIMEVGFRVRAQGGSTELRFGSLPLDALIATVDAKPVQRVQYAASQLSIGQRRRVLGGRVVGQTLAGSEWRLELQAIDSAGAVVSARDRRLRVRTSDRLETPPTQWQDSGVLPEVTPVGNVRIPLNLDPTRASGFFHLVEE